MISITTTQIDAWIVAFAYPLVRILAFIAAAPLWSTAGIPRRTRVILGLCVTIALVPALPTMPAVAPGSLTGLWILAQQMLIGIGMGFAARIVFSAVDMAGEFIGAQMGLGFATAYDPLSSSQTPVISEFLSLIGLLLFLSLNGHLIYIATLAQSFYAIPVSANPLGAASWLNLVELGSKIFSAGLLLALPVVIALMITNIALAVLTRAAPQLNIFALGFPLTLTGGFVALAISMNYLAVPLQALYEFALSAMLGFVVMPTQ
ncbi:MAG: flagellar biosynthetic protein FliR [Dechloromonas sp.]|jgi:flagellar biosynthetic protein FliR|uniref:Flagellar biosynthetic protein FliR n=1 Tax=Candidatus Dechloromonas phosphorivorans TaxID=2899244 RepID=A0A935K1B9_9RHOO|nr:flagellar biosynthetic protein FliR [Candidatus Dechloromonas phosphorivorans]